MAPGQARLSARRSVMPARGGEDRRGSIADASTGSSTTRMRPGSLPGILLGFSESELNSSRTALGGPGAGRVGTRASRRPAPPFADGERDERTPTPGCGVPGPGAPYNGQPIRGHSDGATPAIIGLLLGLAAGSGLGGRPESCSRSWLARALGFGQLLGGPPACRAPGPIPRGTACPARGAAPAPKFGRRAGGDRVRRQPP